MSVVRILIIAVLAIAPFLFLMGVGTYHLWITHQNFIAWWPMAASLTAAYGLGWYWTRRGSRRLLPGAGLDEPPTYWTDRDHAAWKVIESHLQTTAPPTGKELEDADRYAAEAIALARDVALVYRPGGTDPFGHLTMPEVLTCAELVAHDLAKKVNAYVPGSHLMSIDQWKKLRQAIDWGERAWNLSWLARAVVDPLHAGMQFVAAKAGGGVLTQAQNNVLAWFYTAYVHELGRYLIELNSGRLKVGAKRYLELIAAHEVPPTVSGPSETSAAAPVALPLTVAVIGQVKAGKSSLVNALLGEHKAETDVLPLTAGVTKYAMKRPGLPQFTLLDTAGYGMDGPNDSDFEQAFAAAREADVLLIVSHARTAARKADADMLARLSASFAARPELRRPPALIVLTHVDLLTPAAEWAPPYDWQDGLRPKEAAMREAAAAAREQLGDLPAAVVPVCVLPGREFNIVDGLAAAMAAQVDEARGASLLRLFHREGTAAAGRKAMQQVLNVGKEAVKVFWEAAKRR